MYLSNKNVLRATVLAAALGTLSTPALSQSSPGRLQTVTGYVRDSLAGGRPLAGARVELIPATARESAGFMAIVDTSGLFRLDSVPAGSYLFGFDHPKLDSLGLLLPPSTLTVSAGTGTVRADLALPGPTAIGRALCPTASDTTGIILGRLLNASSGREVTDGVVLVRWGEVHISRSGARRDVRGVRARIGANGRFAACGVATDVPLHISAFAGTIQDSTRTDTLGTQIQSEFRASTVEFEASVTQAFPAFYRDLYIAIDSVDTQQRAAGEPNTGGQLTGRVLLPNGKPFAGARVRIPIVVSATRPDTVETVTNADGRYTLTVASLGTQPIEIVALGFAPIRRAVDVRPGQLNAFDATLSRSTPTLREVAVYAAAEGIRTEFAERRLKGVGHFLTASQFIARSSTYIANALVGVGGLRLSGAREGRPILMGRFNCTPTIYINGLRMISERVDETQDLERWMRPDEVDGVEIYENPNQAPPQYQGGDCTTVLFWKKTTIRRNQPVRN
jgi:hypothetical protein